MRLIRNGATIKVIYVIGKRWCYNKGYIWQVRYYILELKEVVIAKEDGEPKYKHKETIHEGLMR